MASDSDSVSSANTMRVGCGRLQDRRAMADGARREEQEDGRVPQATGEVRDQCK